MKGQGSYSGFRYVSIAAEDMPRYPIEKHFDEVSSVH